MPFTPQPSGTWILWTCAAALFLGCQDFPADPHSDEALTSPSETESALEPSDAPENKTEAVLAFEAPEEGVVADEKPAPAAPIVPSAPEIDVEKECLSIHDQMAVELASQNDEAYMQLKMRHSELDCFAHMPVIPSEPADPGDECEGLAIVLAGLDPVLESEKIANLTPYFEENCPAQQP